MTLAAGTRLGPYEILSPLGAGGMGEVYRARDTRLGREVAVKVLPAEVAGDAERLRRFEQEAKAASALNHPNILTLYDVGREGETSFLVTELLEGESLRERLASGALPLRKAIEIGVEIARGLAAAHARGIVHRDLKPDNVFLTSDRVVKILDFGLAKLTIPEGGGIAEATTLPGLTATGVLLGTAGYMAPEQVRGERADARSDLFALGCVIYEMACGQRAFRGSSTPETLSAILRDEPQPLATGDTIGNALGKIVSSCLEKRADDRFQSARDLAVALQALADAPSGVASRRPAPGARGARWRWPAAAVALVILGVVAGRLLSTRDGATTRERIEFRIAPPDGGGFLAGNAESHDLALSPDGRALAYVGFDQGVPHLYVRDFANAAASELAGTEGAHAPFWAPDGRQIGFLADQTIKRVPRDGGTAQVICEIQGDATASWSRTGVIVFGQRFRANPGLFRVSASGGRPEAISTGDLPSWVEFLPGGKRFLYWSRAKQAITGEVHLRDLESGDDRKILELSTQARYAAPGWLLYIDGGTLVARRFDAGSGRFSGDEIPIAAHVPHFFQGWASFTVAASGSAIAYQVEPPARPLAWLDRRGRELGRVGPPAFYRAVRLSPDGRSAAVTVQDPASAFTDVWIVDLEHGGSTRLSDEPLLEWAPTWSPDGSRVAYADVSPGPINTIRIRRVADAAIVTSLAPHPVFFWPRAWTARGLFIDATEPLTGWNLMLWPAGAAPETKPEPLLATEFREELASPSPDDRWLAFFSNESGGGEIELARVDAPTQRIRLSKGAQATAPRWRADGRELFYVSAEGWMTAVAIGDGDPPGIGAPEPLFPVLLVNEDSFDVSADGQRFLVATTSPPSALPVTVDLDWQAALEKR